MSRLITTLVCAILVSACASGPVKELEFERLRSELAALERDEAIVMHAAGELDATRIALEQLATLSPRDEARYAHQVYVVERRIDIARARATQRTAERERAEILRRRDQALVRASLAEAERAREEAEQLRRQALVHEEEAGRERERAEAALDRSRSVEEQAELARREAEQARRLADARAREAELARREAELSAAEASSLKRQLENLQATETDRGLVFTLGDVLFRSGQAELRAESLSNLSRLIGFINQYPGRRVSIEGHTDSRGSEAFNLDLSTRRAEAVRRALVEQGVNSDRLQVVGLGEEFPIASNDTEFGRQQNRRVEIVILKAGQ